MQAERLTRRMNKELQREKNAQQRIEEINASSFN